MLNTLSTKAYIATTEAIRSARTSLRTFVKDERGVTTIEYGLIAIAMAVLIMYAFYGDGSFVGKLKAKFSDLANTISSQNISPNTAP